MAIRLGRDICADLHAAEHREWLVCNGIGGYASGTVAGLPTRGYHGLLVAALDPPVGRTLMFVAALETLSVAGRSYELATLRWRGGSVVPDGHRHLESFTLEGTVPAWRFVCEGTVLEKRIWMDQGANTTRIEYRLVHAEAPVELAIGLIADCRDYHGRTTAGAWKPAVAATADAITVESYPGAPRLHVWLEGATADAGGTWYSGFDLARERERGLQDFEDHLHAGTLSVRMAPGANVQLVASTDGDQPVDPAALERRRAHEADLISRWSKSRAGHGEAAPSWVAQLVLAADQFIVARTAKVGEKGHSIIAGYHWFSDWGRDTMISLPGLTLATGRAEIAASILRTFAGAVDQGMVPNRFPDAGSSPEFNTVDATFWFFDAARRTVEATGDEALLAELFPVLASIIDWHRRGTRYGIQVDTADGLIRAGEPGIQLTWMDAKVGDWVVTPRIGKPIEVNALWLNALAFMADAAGRLSKPADQYHEMQAAATAGFARFWNAESGYCFDVLDGPTGNEAVLRPNQIFAVSLPVSPLSGEQQRAVVRAVEQGLLTSPGLRSLAPTDPEFQPGYDGDQRLRDGAYHRGAVWGWLIGPFIEAHLRAFGDVARVEQILEPLGDQLLVEGLGTVNEIFAGAAPFAPRGCIAQAWSVAEYLRAWHLVDAFRMAPTPKGRRKQR